MIQEVSGTKVTFEFKRDLLNGTLETGGSWVDVSGGKDQEFLLLF
jgi:hypothetical protein